MKCQAAPIAILSIFLIFILLAHAHPALELARAKVPDKPIKFINAPGREDELECGEHKYSGRDIYLAAQWAVMLNGAGETRGFRKWPHPIDSNDSKGVNLEFNPATCPEHDTSRMLYPLQHGDRYDGGKKNKNAGDERVVFYHKKGNNDRISGQPNVYFCGLITHKGAAEEGGFVRCF